MKKTITKDFVRPSLFKNSLKMKLTTLLLVISLFQMKANGYSQDTKVSLTLKEATIEQVFKEIESKTEFRFLYKNKDLDLDKKYTIDIKDKSVKKVLNQLFKDSKVAFELFENRQIVLSLSKERNNVTENNFTVAPVEAPVAIAIKGKVTDEKGAGLPGVSILVRGTKRGTTTDANGEYSINVTDNKAVLVFSFVGFASQEIVVGDKTQINVSLKTESKALDEIVVVGYGTQKKKDLTGAVVHTNLKSKGESPSVSLASALQGVVPGLNIGAVTRAGTDPLISIRGRTSISGSNSPLIVLDGIIYRGNLVDINPADIEAVDVLKDASATAIYGSQASNGVIIISSKMVKTSKKPTLEYSSSVSVQSVSNKSMLPTNGAGFIQKIKDRFINESHLADLITPNPAFDPASKFFGPEILAGYQNGTDVNWWKLLTNESPLIVNHNLSLSGKSEGTSYLLSAGLTDQKNVIKNDTYKRYNFRINLETKVYDWMKVGVQSFMSVNDYSGATPNLRDFESIPNQVAAYGSDGKPILFPYRGILNPLLQTEPDDLDKRNNLNATVYADINVPFVKGLNYRANFSPSSITTRQYNFNPYAENQTGSATKTNQSQYSVTLDHILTYKRAFGDHSLNVTLLSGSEKITFEGTTAKSIKFLNNSLGYNFLGAGQAGLQTANSSAWEESSLYSMARASYGYKGRYLFTGTVRRDGFSGFGSNNKFGVFPSAAASWRLGEESFIKDNFSKLDDLKLRASYGVSGNRTVGRYQTLAQIKSGVGTGYLFGDGGTAEPGQYVTSLPNNDLKWETTKSLNFGLDFSFFKGRLSGSAEYYTAKTHDLLYSVDIPVINGFSSTLKNIGRLGNTGQELTLTGIPVQTEDFSWTVSANFSRNRNKVESILGIDNNKDGIEDDLVSSKLFIGKPYGVAYDFNIIGMWQIADFKAGTIPAGFTYGTYKVEDLNKDNAYSAASDRKILGYTDPSYRFSIQNTFKYKDFDLKVFINSIQGGKDYYYGQPGEDLQNPDNAFGFNSFKFDYWTPENPNARYRQIGFYTTALGERFSPYVQRSFIRLQDVTFGYNLPKNLIKRAGISSAKIYVNGSNLFTWTNWDGWDPETGTGLAYNTYPTLKSYTFGINLQF